MKDLNEGVVPLHSVLSLNPLQPPKLSGELSHYVIQRVKIKVNDELDHPVPGIIHVPKDTITTDAAVILISGAGGGTSGPAGMYISLADKLARLCSLPTLRLDYREPATNKYCTADVLAGISFIADRFQATRFVVCGWSFGSAPALTAAVQDERIQGVACVAPQTAETSGVYRLSPRPFLLLHGTGDRTLSPRCSKQLYEAYGDDPNGDRTLKLFEGDDHGLTKHALEAEEALFEFVARTLGRQSKAVEAGEAVKEELIGDRQERISVMKQGHDLEGESLA